VRRLRGGGDDSQLRENRAVSDDVVHEPSLSGGRGEAGAEETKRPRRGEPGPQYKGRGAELRRLGARHRSITRRSDLRTGERGVRVQDGYLTEAIRWRLERMGRK
jgi:hypothetical protein